MDRDTVIALARQAHGPITEQWWDMDVSALACFAALVAAHEREACAKVCEQSDEDGEGPDCWGWHSKDYAAAIRSRT